MTQATPKRFKPEEHLRDFTRRQRQTDGSYRTVTNKYLDVKWRLVWFRQEQPNGSIVTKLLTPPGVSPAVVQATISIPQVEVDSEGVPHNTGEQVVVTGFGQQGTDDWSDWLEKAETRAIGRALGLLGYGTQFCEDFDEPLADSPVDAAPQSVDKPQASPKASPKAGGYQPLTTSGDIDQDVAAFTERISACRSPKLLQKIKQNAEDLGVYSAPEIHSALMAQCEKFLKAVRSLDGLEAVKTAVEGLGFGSDQYLKEVYNERKRELSEGVDK